jgi:ketopantoate reductase
MTRQRVLWVVLWSAGLLGPCVRAQTGPASVLQSAALTEAVSQPADSDQAPQVTDLPAAFDRQRQTLSMQRQSILATHEKQQQACWQKFAVNACLTEARRVRRQALEPIRQQELVLNAQERAWRTEQRERRLQGKRTDQTGQP